MQTQKCTISYKDHPHVNPSCSSRHATERSDHSLVRGKWKSMTDPLLDCLSKSKGTPQNPELLSLPISLPSHCIYSTYCNKAESFLLGKPSLFILQALLVRMCSPVPMDAESCNNAQSPSQWAHRKFKSSYTHSAHSYEFHGQLNPLPTASTAAAFLCVSVCRQTNSSHVVSTTAPPFKKIPQAAKQQIQQRDKHDGFLHFSINKRFCFSHSQPALLLPQTYLRESCILFQQ